VAKSDVLLSWFAESYDNIVENQSSNDHLTYHEAKMGILNLPYNHRSPCGTSSKNSKPQNRGLHRLFVKWKAGQDEEIGASSSSISGSKECNWGHKYSPSTAYSHIWTQYKELKTQRDRNGAKIVALIQEVANTVSSNSWKWIFDTGASSHMTLGRNYFESISSVRGNVVHADTTQIE
jgi:hypothetical protein